MIIPWQWANNQKRWTILFKDQVFSSNLVLFNLRLVLFSAIKLCIFQTLLVDLFVVDPSGIIFEVRKDTTFQNISLKSSKETPLSKKTQLWENFICPNVNSNIIGPSVKLWDTKGSTKKHWLIEVSHWMHFPKWCERENKMANGIKLLSIGWRSIDQLKISILYILINSNHKNHHKFKFFH